MALWELDGLRVIELGSGIPAAYGARLLADFGADVIKVEPPDIGDEARRTGPFPGDEPDPEKSGLYLYLNFNKRGITLDIESGRGAALLGRLLEEADVLIEHLGAGQLTALPLLEDSITERLIVCSISPYGQDGPKAGYLGSELSAYASGGMMYITGEGEREPLKQALNQASHNAGINAASAILAAAIRQRRQSIGDRIDISLQEAVAVTIFPAFTNYTHTGAVQGRGRGDVPRLIHSMPMRTSDGWVLPAYAGIGTWWESFANFVELPELAAEELLTPAGRQEHAELIDEKAGARFRERTKAELFHGGQEWGMTFTALQTAEEIVNSDHLEDRGYFIEQDHPASGRVKMAGMVPVATGIERAPRRPAPLLGEHTAEVLEAIGVTQAELKQLRGTGTV